MPWWKHQSSWVSPSTSIKSPTDSTVPAQDPERKEEIDTHV
jgi:hypothetical protein